MLPPAEQHLYRVLWRGKDWTKMLMFTIEAWHLPTSITPHPMIADIARLTLSRYGKGEDARRGWVYAAWEVAFDEQGNRVNV